MISKTIVVTNKGLKPTFWHILLRTIFRLSPFDLMSFMFGLGKGQHDYFSKTSIIDTVPTVTIK